VRVLVVTATSSEADALRRIPGIRISSDGFIYGNYDITMIITGVGSVATSWAMAKWLTVNPKPDLVINVGIAGSYREEIKIGEVVIPISDCFADAGIENGTGFMTLEEAGLEDPDRFPYRGGKILANNKFIDQAVKRLRPVKAITVNTASGLTATIEKLKKKYSPDIETMEGAAFFYICSGEKLPFLALRSISNIVEPRNREKWEIPIAIENLSEKFLEILLSLEY